jgi:hypothetical protein
MSVNSLTTAVGKRGRQGGTVVGAGFGRRAMTPGAAASNVSEPESEPQPLAITPAKAPAKAPAAETVIAKSTTEEPVAKTVVGPQTAVEAGAAAGRPPSNALSTSPSNLSVGRPVDTNIQEEKSGQGVRKSEVVQFGKTALSIDFSYLADERRRAYFRGESGNELTPNEEAVLNLLGIGTDASIKASVAPYLADFFMNLRYCQTPTQLQLSSKCSLNQMVLWNIHFADEHATRKRIDAERQLRTPTTTLAGILPVVPLMNMLQRAEEEVGPEEDNAAILQLFELSPYVVPEAITKAKAKAPNAKTVPTSEDDAIRDIFTLM